MARRAPNASFLPEESLWWSGGQQGTRLELAIDRARPAHISQNLSPARKQPPLPRIAVS